MKYLTMIIVVLTTTLILSPKNTFSQYDSTLAKELGADEYGMKMYVFVMLKSGETKIEDDEKRKEVMAGHLLNIQKLVTAKKMVVAGPMGENENNLRGIFIMNVSKVEEAEILLQSDPAISIGALKAEYYPWYGSAALPKYLPYHDKIEKNSVSE
ncbi:YciI family protein [Salibacter halophilus]|uniref:YCII-related domain-containing protein n=1 Tax=Salibacter halophilus TaxID=1803916 RepID=A0A6N6MDL4_9FLAO|nr:YciI family protein [Salibacter halophilus]KAB1065669.1 hypothetical protein F3059_03165 [Salibacter halophilus]